MKPAVTVVGAGRMGSALARAFIEHGYETTVWNRTRAKLEPLGALGARLAPSLRAAVAGARIVVVNLKDYAAADEFLHERTVADTLRGKLLVQLTSGSPRQARQASDWAASRGIAYLDGAIMATPDIVGGPACTILYSGPREPFEENRDAFLALGGNAVHVGTDVGHASALDSALLVVMWGALFGALQGAAICRAEELRLDAFRGYLAPVLPQVNGWVMDTVKRVEDGRLAADRDTLASIEVHDVALRCLLELCRDRGIHRAIPEAMGSLFAQATTAGHSQDDFAMLSRFMR